MRNNPGSIRRMMMPTQTETISRLEMKLEVVPIPVSDVDAAKTFYTEQVGFNLDHDIRPNDRMRIVQMTPPGSARSGVVRSGAPPARRTGVSERCSAGGR